MDPTVLACAARPTSSSERGPGTCSTQFVIHALDRAAGGTLGGSAASVRDTGRPPGLDTRVLQPGEAGLRVYLLDYALSVSNDG